MIYLYSLYDKIIIIFSVYISKKYKNLYCKIILVVGIFWGKVDFNMYNMFLYLNLYIFLKLDMFFLKKFFKIYVCMFCIFFILNKYVVYYDWY